MTYTNWREDPGMESVNVYQRRFAFRKTTCSGGEIVRFCFYYKMYCVWSHGDMSDDYQHIDFVENITEAEYIVRRLIEIP